MPYPHLLSPVQIGNMKLPNRIIMAPMTRGRAGSTLTANELMAEYYAQRASAGLVITEGTHTSVLGRGWYQAPDIFTPAHVDGWKLVTDRVHARGGRIFCQLWHTGRQSHSSFRDGIDGYEGEMKKGVGPSPIKRFSERGKQDFTNLPAGQAEVEIPRELSTEEVDALPEEYKNSALMAQKAGFDGIEIHSSNGYLLDTFLQSSSNQRTDKYGGSKENRFRLVENVIKAVLTVFEPGQVGIRLSPDGAYGGMGATDTHDSYLYYIERLSEYNLAYLHITRGIGPTHGKDKPVTFAEIRKVYPGPIIANSEYDVMSAEEEVASGNVDCVSFGRLFISNPDLVERIETECPLNDTADFRVWFTTVENTLAAEGYTDFPTMEKN